MSVIKIDDLARNIAAQSGVPRHLAEAGAASIKIAIDHALAERGRPTTEEVVPGALLLKNLTKEELVSVVLSGGPFTRRQAERAVESAQKCLIEELKQSEFVEVQHLGKFRIAGDQRDIGPESPLVFTPVDRPRIP